MAMRDDFSSSERKRQLAFTNTLLFETPGGTRYTQDSPILPNVWLAYALEPRKQQELILTASQESHAGQAASELRRTLMTMRERWPDVGDEDRDPEPRERARVAYIPGQIAVKLYFDELMRIVLPLTPWWHEAYDRLRTCEHQLDVSAHWKPFPRPDEGGHRQRDLVDALMLMRREIDPTVDVGRAREKARENGERQRYIRELPPNLIWLVRIAGIFADCFAKGTNLLEGEDSLSARLNRDFKARKPDRIENQRARESRVKETSLPRNDALETRKDIVDAFVHLYDAWPDDDDYPTSRLIWRVTKNRPVQLAVTKSALTVKADAARKLFSISCRDITWAVLDSGIDSRHPAFRLTTPEHERRVRRELAGQDPSIEDDSAVSLPVEALESRVVETLDFTYLRELLDLDLEPDPNHPEASARRQRLVDKVACRMTPKDCDCEFGGACNPAEGEALGKARTMLERLRERIENGKELHWEDLQEALVNQNPPVPTNDHGTHVAGILGADWIEDREEERKLPLALRTRRMVGICPDINLIDVRVFREDGLTDEFELLAALQYLRWMNSRAGTMKVHGANLSLSLIHEVRRFACGRTPICDECDEATALGMVIVAAAGNRGFEMNDLEEVTAADSYKSVSVTDPGNAASVITVGATHRKRPHEYGVSYFSSRGPTGDGRLKPDLVAPGEKIKGPTPNGRAEFKDGTSMAAPHVSGAAALLIARHKELIGQPERVKAILCETATDLKRERYFQGHGLVDTLRALQSI